MTNKESKNKVDLGSEDRMMLEDRIPDQDREVEGLFDERVIEDGAYIDQGGIHATDIPAGVERPGYEYIWARRDVKGLNDFRIDKLESQAWRAVESWRAINHKGPMVSSDYLSEKYITRADCILMERPIHYRTMEDRTRVDGHANHMRSLRGVKNQFNTPLEEQNIIGY